MKYPQLWIPSIIFFLCIINAGESEYISGIEFTGNSSINKSELRSVISLQSSQLFVRKEFSAKKLNKDKILLETYYKSKGFLEVKITQEYVSESENYIKINFYINEGKQYKLKKIELYGNKFFSDAEILKVLNERNSQYYNPVEIRKRLISLKRKYLNIGKLDIGIMDEINILENYVTARINISEGSTYYIKNINVIGLETVKEKYVMRELLFANGELYNIDKIDGSKNRIFESRLFSSVEMFHNIIDNDSGLLDINIKVREYKSSSVEGNFGFKEEPGTGTVFERSTKLGTNVKWIIGNIQHTPSNIEISASLASKINLSIFTDIPEIERDYAVSYTNPWTISYRLPLRIKYFHEESFSLDEREIVDGFKYSIEYNKDRKTRYEISSIIKILESDNDKDPLRELNFKYRSNKIHRPLNPEGGHYLLLSSSLYGTFLGGERHYFKLQGEYRKYIKAFNRNVFAFRMFAGYIYNFDKSNPLKNIYLFNIGGQTSLRGWKSPEAYNEAYKINGALINDMINLEYRFHIWKKIGGEFFIDCGRLYDEINLFTTTQISWDYGVGTVYHSTLGPIRIDLAFPYEEPSKFQVHASLLYMF